MMIYKCADCNAVSCVENNFRCQSCGGQLVGFSLPSIEPQPSRVDVKRVLYGLGVGVLFIAIGAVIFLGCLM